MSAESPRRGVHKGTQIISPQPIIDRSIINNVAVIINDIVPQVNKLSQILRYIHFSYSEIMLPILR